MSLSINWYEFFKRFLSDLYCLIYNPNEISYYNYIIYTLLITFCLLLHQLATL